MSDLDDVKRRILAKVDLPQLIGETVQLTRKSGNYAGCCPFHAEKTPSFYVYPDHYYCFGTCKEGGDAISFVRKREGLGFVEALRWLAAKYGVDVPELDQARSRLGSLAKESQLYKMMLDAQEFYQRNLQGPHGGEALAYLAGRGFSPDNVKAFGFGLTPLEGAGLVRHLRSLKHGEADMIACSLATTSNRDGKTFDFLRGRVTLPIHDQQGRIIGFGGRTLDGSQPKYLNSGASKLFDKSRTLFGFDKARRVMRERGRAIVVEGYMDALQLWQAGFPETVACLGTAFTEAQMKLLGHATDQVILLFDGDGAGQKATLTAVNVALTQPEVATRCVALPEGDDPDSFVKKNGAEALTALIATSSELMDFVVRERVKETHALGVPELVSKEFVPWLAKVTDLVTRSFLVARIAQLTGVPAAVLEQQLRGAKATEVAKARAGATPDPQAPLRPLEPLDRISHDLFGHVFHATPGELDTAQLRTLIKTDLDLGPEHSALIEDLLTALDAGISPASRQACDWALTLDPQLSALLAELAAKAAAFHCNDRRLMMVKLGVELTRRRVKASVSRHKAEMSRIAIDPSRVEEMREILKTIGDLTRVLRELEKSETPS